MRFFCFTLFSMLCISSFAQLSQAVPGVEPQPCKPDLIITSFTVSSPAVLHCGTQYLTFTFTEKNIGCARTGLYTNYVYVNGGAAIAVPRRSLAAGATRTATFTKPFYNGPCDCLPTSYSIPIYMMADGPNTVDESNEGNNNSATVTVAAQCP